MTAATTPSAYDHPDWDTLAHEVFCPLCDYNLRTLTQPRCPECGYQFHWPDLLDPARRDHEYLFEHHRKRAFRSFWQTAYHGLRPTRFWKTLRPDQRSVPRRLISYGLIVASAVLFAIASEMGLHVLRWYLYFSRYAPFRRGTWRWNWDDLWELSPPYITKAAVLLAWPWLTYLSLMILQISMRRAKLRRDHVVRCVIYCYDIVLWVALIQLLLNASRGGMAMAFGYRVSVDSVGTPILIWLCAWPLFAYRLIIAYWHYLRFRHVIATILLTQLIVFLFVLTVLTFCVKA
ncbi:MAG: hypothetical protein JWN24_1401 [Phycisphaerales bacterium]|nr:hypothetical protein [Phycisphaerales bacterium]